MMNIFVGNLSLRTTEQELQNEFEKFGEVGSVKIITDRETLKSRGFAFVTMPDQAQATAAIAGINGKVLDGHILKANEARPREARPGQSHAPAGSGYGSGDRFSNRSGLGDKARGGGSGGYGNNEDIYDSKGGSGGRRRGRRDSGMGGRSGGRRSPR
ncbi:MAG: RNA-binding protein [Syntrophobacteraceae bacterium]|nr:RNA-binding protein [Desulfobacteraceae bacterium]